MEPKWSQNRTQDAPKSKLKTKTKKEALEDRLGAVLGRSWVVLGAVLGPSWGRRMGFRLGETAFRESRLFSQDKVRQALSMAIDRPLLVEIGYGKAGGVTCDLVPAPDNYAAKNDYCVKQDIAGANALLESAGWKKGADGIRAKDGVRISILYQTSTNAVRQDFQALIKELFC